MPRKQPWRRTATWGLCLCCLAVLIAAAVPPAAAVASTQPPSSKPASAPLTSSPGATWPQTEAADGGAEAVLLTTAPPPPSDEPLRQWLYNLDIPVPNISVPVPLLGDFNITQLTCTHLLLGNITSDADIKNTTYHAALDGLSIDCKGHYSTKIIIKLSGPLSLQLTPKSSLDLGVHFVTGAEGLATAAEARDVAVDVETNVDFENIPKPLRNFIQDIDKALTPTINKELAKVLTGLINTNLTAILRQVNKDIAPFMHPPRHVPPPPAPPGTDNLTHSPLLDVLSFFLDTGFSRGIVNQLVDVFTNGTGGLQVALPHAEIQLPLGPLGNITLGARALAVGGLDTWANDTLFLHPHDSYSVLTETDLKQFDLNVSWYVIVNTTAASRGLVEDATLSLSLSDATLTADAFLAINEDALDSLPTSRLFNPDCLLSVTSDLNLTAFSLNFTTDALGIIAAAGTTERDIDSLLNNLLSVLFLSYAAAVPAVLDTLLMDVVRPEVNVAAQAAIANASCPPQPQRLTTDHSAMAGYLASAGASFLFIVIGIVLSVVGRRLTRRRRRQQKLQKQKKEEEKKQKKKEKKLQKKEEEKKQKKEKKKLQKQRQQEKKEEEEKKERGLLGKEENTAATMNGINGNGIRAYGTVGAADWGVSSSSSSSSSNSSSSGGGGGVMKGGAVGSSERDTLLNTGPVVVGGRSFRYSSRDSFFTFPNEEDQEETTALLANRVGHTSSAAPCLALEPSVSLFARYSVPLMLLGTVALFIWSNNSLGASVVPQIRLNDDIIRFDPLFSFDLTNSVRDMWNARVYALSLLIGAFSGSWPYLKLLLMLTSWLMPTSWLSVPRRETLLRVLDAFGKWSLIDSFVLVMMLVAFRFHLPFRAPETDPTVASFDIFVLPAQGFHSFVVATMLSLAMSHVILHMHRTAAEYHRKGRDATINSSDDDSTSTSTSTTSSSAGAGVAKQVLARHAFTTETGARYVLTYLGSVLLMGIVVASMFLLGFGAAVDAFSFEFKGLAALAMSYDGMNPTRNFSLISVGETIPSSVPNPDNFSIRYIQALFFILALAVPMAHFVSLIAIWCLPLTTRAQERLFHAAEVLNAWSCLDVFVVSLLAAVLEIEQFAQFIIGHKCDPIEDILKPYKDEWPRLRGDTKCFDVVTHLKQGSWALFGSAVASLFTIWVVMPLCHRALKERVQGPRYTRDHKLHSVSSMESLEEDEPRQRCAPVLRGLQMLKIIRYEGMDV